MKTAFSWLLLGALLLSQSCGVKGPPLPPVPAAAELSSEPAASPSPPAAAAPANSGGAR